MEYLVDYYLPHHPSSVPLCPPVYLQPSLKKKKNVGSDNIYSQEALWAGLHGLERTATVVRYGDALMLSSHPPWDF